MSPGGQKRETLRGNDARADPLVPRVGEDSWANSRTNADVEAENAALAAAREDTERPTVRQHEELQRAYEEALGRANRAEKSLRGDTERPEDADFAAWCSEIPPRTEQEPER